MHYRAGTGEQPMLRDECGIPSIDGPPVLPDVVLVPCLGYTASGYRLGYGGGYFDRWLAAYPQVVGRRRRLVGDCEIDESRAARRSRTISR